MNLDGLVCASCAHPVTEGRCPTCRHLRLDHGRRGPLSPEMIVALIGLLALLVWVVAHMTA